MQYFGKAALRRTKNYTKGYSSTQVKFREATSNDPWGPSINEMNEIAQMTYNQKDFYEIMDTLQQQLDDKAKNWRHVFKSLNVLEHCLLQGSEHVVIYCQVNVHIIKTLKEFQYVDRDGKDQGAKIRQKANDITNLLLDDSRLQEERRSRTLMRDPMIRLADGGGGDWDDGSEAHRKRDARNGLLASVPSDQVPISGSELLPGLLSQEAPDVDNATRPVLVHELSSNGGSACQKNQKIESLVAVLEEIFSSQEKYKQLLLCHDIAAQRLLDMFQRLLDLLQDKSRPKFRSDLIVAVQRLAGRSGLYPTCFELKDVITVGEFCESNGAFADIYRGTFKGRSVCLKTIRLDQKTDIQYFLKACSKEAILWGQLSHPNLLPFYGIYRFRNRLSLVSPWMEHGDMSSYLRRHPSANRVLLASDVAHGLRFLHDNGIIHGDLKGPNILVNELGRACVADFGLSSISDPNIAAWTTQSSVASKGGSVRWQAPELFDPESDEDIHNTVYSDVYAWACVAYEERHIPFSHLLRDTAISLRVLNGERPARPEDSSLSWTAWGLTERLWMLMEEGWKADPASRPTVEQIIKRLDSEMIERSAGLHETRTGAEWLGNALSPPRFREMARVGSGTTEGDDISVQTLEMLLNTK